MNEYDDQWLRDGLAAAVPAPPEAADRARNATVKARRGRRVRAAGVLGVAAVVVAAAVAWNVSDDGSDRAADPAGPAATTCPPDLADVDSSKATGVAGDGLPLGATSARLCLGGGLPFDAPLDPLVTDVDDLIATINDLEPYPASGPDQACTLELGTGYRIVFGYPDGSTVLVSGEPYGCASVVIGTEDYRVEPAIPRDQFVELLRAQRAAAEPPSTVPAADLRCQSDMSPVGSAADITEAVYCADGPGPGVPIPAEDLAVLVADMQTSEPVGVTTFCYTPGRIVGLTSWGDTVQTSALCGGDRWSMEDDLAWQVSPASKTILDRLAAEHSLTPP